MSRVDVYVIVIVIFAGYGLGTAIGKLLGNDAPAPITVRYVVVETTSGCAL